MMSRIENELQAVRNVFINYPKQYKLIQEALAKIDDERMDILHALELGKLNAIEMSKLMRELKEVSKQRRRLKEELEILEDIVRFSEGKISKHDLSYLIGKVRKTFNRQENRKYTMRVRHDLQEVVDSK